MTVAKITLTKKEIAERQRLYDLRYPNGLDLKPGTMLHDEIVENVMTRARQASRTIATKYKKWEKIDDNLSAFVPLDTEEKKIKNKDDRKPVSMVIPISYAVLDTMLTYLIQSFSQDRLFRYEPRTGEDTLGTLYLEKIIQQQTDRTNALLELHTMWRDAIAYGIGIIAVRWERWTKTRAIRGTGIDDQELKDFLDFEGNILQAIDPFSFLPDPDVPIHKVNEARFMGWFETVTRNLLIEEEQSTTTSFNAIYTKEQNEVSSVNTRFRQRGEHDEIGGMIDRVKMYINIIPKEWGLGESMVPEKWYFNVAADEVLTECRPMGLHHQKFPIVVSAPNYDGHSLMPISNLEVLYPMQQAMDWLFSSHLANVRKSVNDRFIVDPYMINMADLQNNTPGHPIRTRRHMWGKGVEGGIKQLQMNDLTRGNIQDANLLINYAQRVTGVSDSVQGIQARRGERVSATEAQGSRQSALSRLEKIARIMAMQSITGIGTLMAEHTLQFMSEETTIKILGDDIKSLESEYSKAIQQGRMKVKVDELNVMYDVRVGDGDIPGKQDIGAWIQLLNIAQQNPAVLARIDFVKVFQHIARELGVKNLNNFVLMPDEEVQRQQQLGMLQPASPEQGEPTQ